MFSEKSKLRIEYKFSQLLQELPVIQEEVATGLKACKADTALAIKYLYTAMPFSDIGNYPFETFLDYAVHGIKLWEDGAYSKKIPEDIFLNYVLYHRINEEEILPCRTFFYEKLKNRVKGLAVKEAVLEVNYWCAGEVAYRSGDERTAAPITVYNCGYGRCGEESAFAVSALRSIGIPARQVYTPRWAHCDDNHAWIEIWCDGTWYFFGACEPEEILNKGWFTGASSRAMLIHSRWFDYTAQKEEVISKEGMVTLINQLERYAPVQAVCIQVVDENEIPIQAAKVEFQILNYSEFASLANLWTDETGRVTLKLGLGNVHIHVSKNDNYAELLIDTRTRTNSTIVLKEGSAIENCWEAFDMIAPSDSPVNANLPTARQKAEGEAKFAGAAAKRMEKVKNLWNNEIDKFLNMGQNGRGLKEKMLSVLTAKDHNDCKAEILEEHFQSALPYLVQFEEKIFLNYLLNPRIRYEPIFKYRAYISDYFSGQEKESFQNQPKLIWDWIEKKIDSREEKEHPNVITSPLGCLKLGIGNLQSKQTLFVAIARTIGIPARLNPKDGTMEYWNKGEFIPVFESSAKSSKLLLLSGDGKITWTYYQNFTIARYDKGFYTTLKLDREEFNNGQLKLSLEPGNYRIITSNRLPNGNIFAYQYRFSLKAEEEKNIILTLREANLLDMLENITMNDFSIKSEAGEPIPASEITKDGKKILIWLEESKEPTEHILNELLERQKEFGKYTNHLIFIVHSKKSLEDNTISKVLDVFPNTDIYFDDFIENVQTLGRRFYVDPDKLPLIIVTSKVLNGIYAASGYNVGTGDMLLRLLKEVL